MAISPIMLAQGSWRPACEIGCSRNNYSSQVQDVIELDETPYSSWIVYNATREADEGLVRAYLLASTTPYVDDARATALHVAAEKGYDAILTRLIASNKFDINGITYGGRTPLHLAVKNNQLNVVKLLLKAKANPNIQDVNGRTSLYECALNSYNACTSKMDIMGGQMARLLVDAKADVNVQDMFGNTPLHISRRGGSVFTTATDVLLAAGASLHAKNNKGEAVYTRMVKDSSSLRYQRMLKSWTLFAAISVGDTQDVKKLLRQVPFSIKDNDGNNLLHMAIESGDKNMVGLILFLKPSLIVEENAKNETPLHKTQKPYILETLVRFAYLKKAPRAHLITPVS